MQKKTTENILTTNKPQLNNLSAISKKDGGALVVFDYVDTSHAKG